MTFAEKQKHVEHEGFHLEHGTSAGDGHVYNVWFNSPTGSKEIFCRNFTEVDLATEELRTIRCEESKLSDAEIKAITKGN